MAECYHCGSEDHFYRDCPVRQGLTDPAKPKSGTIANFCPMCGSQPMHTCRNLDTGGQMFRADGAPVFHPARGERIWQNPVTLKRRQQLREARPDLYGKDTLVIEGGS